MPVYGTTFPKVCVSLSIVLTPVERKDISGCASCRLDIRINGGKSLMEWIM